MEAMLRVVWRRPCAWWFLLPCVLYVACAALLSDFVIDDAGISFAYARNVATGHGFVSQPGRPPVEGFSNFLWVVLLIPTFLFHLFHPVWTPKVLATLLVFLSLFFLLRSLRRANVPPLVCFLLGAAIALSPPIVIWTTSGLENSLTLFLLSLLFATFIEKSPKKEGSRRPHFETQCGVIVGLLALTRPDGLIYAAFFAGVAAYGLLRNLWARGSRPRIGAGQVGGSLMNYAVGFVLIFAPFMAFRWSVFGLLFPHPYYAKRIHSSFGAALWALASDPSAAFEKFLDLSKGVFGPAGPALFALTALFAMVLALRRGLSRPEKAALTLQIISVGGYLWMDADWMGEYRFATGAILFSMVSFALMLDGMVREGLRVLKSNNAKGEKRVAAGRKLAFLGAGLVLLLVGVFLPRTLTFAANPPTKYSDVERSSAAKFNRYAEALGLRQGSVFLPDVGATLFTSKLTVFDAAGLCEPEVIRTLKKGTQFWLNEHPEFYDFVFDELRPTFISTHHFWTYVAAFDNDPRFRRDYVAINAYEDAYVTRVFGRKMHSGDFVRRDALTSYDRIELLRISSAVGPRNDPWAVGLHEAAASFLAPSEAREGGAVGSLPPSVRAQRAIEKNDPHRAATLLAEALAKDPSNIQWRFLRASVLDEAARPDEARIEWQRVLDLVGLAASPYEKAAKMRLFGH